MLSTRTLKNLPIFLHPQLSTDSFTTLQNFIAIKQRKTCLRRKYVDFENMLSDPCLNIAEIKLDTTQCEPT